LKFEKIEGLEFIIYHLKKLGFGQYGQMGLVPLSFQEIGAYIEYAKVPLQPKEVTLIRELSEIYCSYLNNKNPQVKSPFKKD
jgi:hypothetical protein